MSVYISEGGVEVHVLHHSVFVELNFWECGKHTIMQDVKIKPCFVIIIKPQSVGVIMYVLYM